MASSKPRGLLLLSGGFDSPVAGLLAQQQGMELYALHFTAQPMFGDQGLPKATALAKKIGVKKLFTCDIGPLLSTFAKQSNPKLYFVFMKRTFLRLAEQVARDNACDALITGENLGQVSSQTLSNMAAIAPVCTLPVIRPLLCLDKQEIIDLSKELGTHDLSVGPEMCDALAPTKPSTESTAKQMDEAENKIALDTLMAQAKKTIKAVF
jgi:thiamine biosynthesis protein ThiI